MTPPVRFAFGLHLHQPVGNFDHVFAEHVAQVYLPFLRRAEARGFFPLVLHLSGPLLEWLEAHDTEYLDLLGRLAAEGKLEFLLAGMYEPVLASLPRRDRQEQIGWLREALRRRFGVEASGLWLTERVWEPELAADLADAGVRYALVDDRHFLVTGFTREQLHRPWMTESDGKRIALFAIDERLRYLVPFRPPEEAADYFRSLRSAGQPLAVLADDGEKFGGWPGTREWVYDRGWLDSFMVTLEGLIERNELVLSTLEDALARVPCGGLAYLPTASYREMEGWSLPSEAAARLAGLERELGEARLSGPDGALVRGAHWLNFLVKYPESNRMHKKMQALSRLCRERADPPAARRAIGRAQCNDAYWHGVFGGLYLPFLRAAVWSQLALAEGILRRGEPLRAEVIDLDADGETELWIHSAHFSALVAPARGAALEELTHFADRRNYADVLTRRREVFHEVTAGGQGHGEPPPDGAPSIHHLESQMRLGVLPPADPGPRVLLAERVVSPAHTGERAAAGEDDALWRSQRERASVTTHTARHRLTLEAVFSGPGAMRKQMEFSGRGTIVARWSWNPAEYPPDARFAVEISLAAPLAIEGEPPAESHWSYDIATVAKSEKGLESTSQGTATVLLWPISLGAALLRLGPAATGKKAPPAG